MPPGAGIQPFRTLAARATAFFAREDMTGQILGVFWFRIGDKPHLIPGPCLEGETLGRRLEQTGQPIRVNREICVINFSTNPGCFSLAFHG